MTEGLQVGVTNDVTGVSARPYTQLCHLATVLGIQEGGVEANVEGG